MLNFLRSRWARYYIKVTHQTSEGQMVEVTFNESTDDAFKARINTVIETLYDRMIANNQRILDLNRQVEESKHPTRAERHLKPAN